MSHSRYGTLSHAAVYHQHHKYDKQDYDRRPCPQLFIFKEHYAPREIHRQLSGIDPQRPLFISAAVGKIYQICGYPHKGIKHRPDNGEKPCGRHKERRSISVKKPAKSPVISADSAPTSSAETIKINSSVYFIFIRSPLRKVYALKEKAIPTF